jgi:hypothetical protein
MQTKQSNQPHSFGAVLKGALILILFVSSIVAYAQNFGSSSTSKPHYRVDGTETTVSVQQQQYNAYQSTVYEPFSSATPSQITERRNTGYSGDVDLGDWGDPDIAEPGDTSGESPVGEPWVLLFFAAAAAVAIRLRRKSVKTTI